MTTNWTTDDAHTHARAKAVFDFEEKIIKDTRARAKILLAIQIMFFIIGLLVGFAIAGRFFGVF